jgi:hypothetical protein
MLLVSVSTVSSGPAFAQSGSTGGTLGKTDKSLSGDRQQESPPRPKQSAAPKVPATKLFNNPEINRVRLDRCLQFGSKCDEPAATAWCKGHGFSSASAWKTEYVSPTIGQDGHRCALPLCGGFTTILCK